MGSCCLTVLAKVRTESLLRHFSHLFTFNPHSLSPSEKQDTHAGRRNECRNSWNQLPREGTSISSF